MPNVALRCKVSRKTGMGHLVRQAHLANQLKSIGWNVTLYPDRYAPALQRLKSEHLAFVPVKNNEEFLNALAPADLVVLDVQNTKPGWMKALKKKTRSLAGFEDLGRGRHCLDLLIDCNLPEGKAGDLSRNVRPLLGLKHCLLSPDFSNYSKTIRNFENGVQSVLITMGGTDPNNLTDSVQNPLIPETRTLKLTIIDPNYNEAGEVWFRNPYLFYLRNTNDMGEMLASHDAVVCAGGVTMHEAMAVGTPAFVIAQVDAQTKLARFAEQQGAVKYLGQAGNWNPGDVKNILNTSPAQLQAMSDAGKATIDGKGIDRVVSALKLLIPS